MDAVSCPLSRGEARKDVSLPIGRGIGLIRNRKDNLGMSLFQVEIGKEWFTLKKFVVPAKAGI